MTPWHVAVSSAGTPFLTDFEGHRVFSILDGRIVSVLGGGGENPSGHPATGPMPGELAYPTHVNIVGDDLLVTVGASHAIVLASLGESRIELVAGGVEDCLTEHSSSLITCDGHGGEGDPPIGRTLSHPTSTALDSHDDLYVSEAHGNRIVRLKSTADGRSLSWEQIEIVVPSNPPGFSADGLPARDTLVSLAMRDDNPRLAIGGRLLIHDDVVYFCDTGNHVVRKIEKGVVSTIAGGGLGLDQDGFPLPGHTGDGELATRATLTFPTDLAMDSQGNLFVSEFFYIRKVSRDGIINTIAGSDDRMAPITGADPLGVRIGPMGLAVDGDDNLYVSDLAARGLRVIWRNR